MLIHVLIVLLTLTSGLKMITGQISAGCITQTKCTCTLYNKAVISLDGVGTLKASDKAKQQDFIWHPCKSFDIGKVKAASVVQHSEKTGLYMDVGSLERVQINYIGQNLVMFLNSVDATKTSLIKLICASGKTIWKFTEDDGKNYAFELHSPYCCPGYQPPSDGLSLSVGSILTITFFAILVSYILFGVMLQVGVRKAEGSQRIPNVEFWTALPGLVRDGFKFTFNKCGIKRASYNEI